MRFKTSKAFRKKRYSVCAEPKDSNYSSSVEGERKARFAVYVAHSPHPLHQNRKCISPPLKPFIELADKVPACEKQNAPFFENCGFDNRKVLYSQKLFRPFYGKMRATGRWELPWRWRAHSYPTHDCTTYPLCSPPPPLRSDERAVHLAFH